MKKHFWKKRHSKMDDYNMPTEPLPNIPAMYFPPSSQSSSLPGEKTMQAPFSSYPDPQQHLPIYPYTQSPSSYVGRYPAYPSWPDAPLGTNYGVWPTAAPWGPGNARTHRTRRRRFLPACVGLFFVCVQLLLVVRFGVRLLGLSPDITWVGVVTDVSEVFISPFRELWFQIPLVGTLLPATIELYTLIAILLYGVLSRLLVGILKIILNSR